MFVSWPDTRSISMLAVVLAFMWTVAVTTPASSAKAESSRMAGTQPSDGNINSRPAISLADSKGRILHQYYSRGKWPSNINNVSIEDLESIGLPPPDAYEADIWLGLDRELVEIALKRISGFPDNQVLFEATRKILATGGRSDLLSRSSYISPGTDFLTLRLKKLNEIGALTSHRLFID